MRRFGSGLMMAALLGGAGCSVSSAAPSPTGESAIVDQVVLSVRPLDLWARPLPEGARLTVRAGASTLAESSGAVDIPLAVAGPIQVHLEAPQYEPIDVTLDYDGGAADSGAKVQGDPSKGFGLAFGHARGPGGGVAHVLYLGLRHKWFSAEGRAPSRGNAVALYMDGEEAWTHVREDIVGAQQSLMVSTWWWESDFELLRPEIGTPADARRQNTILTLLETSPAHKRVLVGAFDGQDSKLSSMTVDPPLMAHAASHGDGFDVMQEGNPTRGKFPFDLPAVDFGARVARSDAAAPRFEVSPPVPSRVPGHDVDLTQMPLHVADLFDLSSIHQKFIVADDQVAFVGGMNLQQRDWDTSEHVAFEPRREDLASIDLSRWAVHNKGGLPDNPPRKDYMVRLEGPAVADVSDVFHERWERLRAAGVANADDATPFDVVRDVAPRPGLEVQVTSTLPAPYSEHAIAETWFNALANAESFIYVEDQYFRAPMMSEAIAARMDQVPGLKLIVVSRDVSLVDPACVQSANMHRFFRQRYGGDRYLVLQLRSFDLETYRFVEIYEHAKMLIVDDVFMSVGSANMNNRGLVYEAEMNVAVVDPIVGEWRRRIARNLLPPGVDSDSPDAWYAALRGVSAANDKAYSAYTTAVTRVANTGDPLPTVDAPPPGGFVYSLGFSAPAKCIMQSVGPDET